MITKNTYYKGDIYIPQAKPSISDDATQVDDDFYFMLSQYEKDCLTKCFGVQLYREFISNIDTEKPTLIKEAADPQWNLLMNGHEYTDSNGNFKYWEGIRYKTLGTDYDTSFLAYYVYWFFEKQKHVTNTSIGHQVQYSKNARTIVPTQKVVDAWNKFVEIVQGKNVVGVAIEKGPYLGVDYYVGDHVCTLYEYINDMNTITEDTFANFKPKTWELLNKFNL